MSDKVIIIKVTFQVNDECSICHDKISGTFVKQTPCNHYFHVKCLSKWDRKNGPKVPCPICRQKYLNTSPIQEKQAEEYFTDDSDPPSIDEMEEEERRQEMEVWDAEESIAEWFREILI